MKFFLSRSRDFIEGDFMDIVCGFYCDFASTISTTIIKLAFDSQRLPSYIIWTTIFFVSFDLFIQLENQIPPEIPFPDRYFRNPSELQ
jgi:hypothetical protein